MSRQKLSAVWSVLSRRGEITRLEGRPNTTGFSTKQVEVRRLFRGHEIADGSFFKLFAESDEGDLELWIFANATNFVKRPTQSILFDQVDSGLEHFTKSSASFHLNLEWKAGAGQDSTFTIKDIPLSRGNALLSRTLTKHQDPVWNESVPVQFVAASTLSSENVTYFYNEIVLTPMEDLVLEALKIIEPGIERIAAVAPEEYRPIPASRGGILIRLSGVKDRIPIASMGDGIWRLLGLALAVVHAKNGLLLVDEIDTGLHYSVMGKMWRFLNECSERFNVQIIATTHSQDCVQSLAEICRADRVDPREVTIQRIDRHRSEAVAYSEAAIIAAAKNATEVR